MADGPATDAPGDGNSMDRIPTVTCSECDREWELGFELEELHAGNRAVEQFALDHERHTGHFPDDVTPWLVDCGHCEGGDGYLAERPARRWAEVHARHTDHPVELCPPDGEGSTEVIDGG